MRCSAAAVQVPGAFGACPEPDPAGDPGLLMYIIAPLPAALHPSTCHLLYLW